MPSPAVIGRRGEPNSVTASSPGRIQVHLPGRATFPPEPESANPVGMTEGASRASCGLHAVRTAQAEVPAVAFNVLALPFDDPGLLFAVLTAAILLSPMLARRIRRPEVVVLLVERGKWSGCVVESTHYECVALPLTSVPLTLGQSRCELGQGRCH